MDRQDKIKLHQAVIVEGKYDKIKLSAILDATIISTDGFRIFKNREQRALIAKLAKTCGILVITDSDTAGFQIRSHIKSIAKEGRVEHLYIPAIPGKERRKRTASKEGTLGVEGLDPGLLRQLLNEQGISGQKMEAAITRQHFYDDGFIGAPDSAARREALLQYLDLPRYMSTKALLGVINQLMTKEQYDAYINQQS